MNPSERQLDQEGEEHHRTTDDESRDRVPQGARPTAKAEIRERPAIRETGGQEHRGQNRGRDERPQDQVDRAVVVPSREPHEEVAGAVRSRERVGDEENWKKRQREGGSREDERPNQEAGPPLRRIPEDREEDQRPAGLTRVASGSMVRARNRRLPAAGEGRASTSRLGKSVKARHGPATVSGDEGGITPLGKPGKAPPEDDPRVRRPALSPGKNPILREGGSWDRFGWLQADGFPRSSSPSSSRLSPTPFPQRLTPRLPIPFVTVSIPWWSSASAHPCPRASYRSRWTRS